MLAAAERYAGARPAAGVSFKAGLQNAVARRSVGGFGGGSGFSSGGEGQGAAVPGKRRLLTVSTSLAVPGDALPAQALFGNSFKVPKLAGRK